MCGISGFNWKDEQRVASMVTTLTHRGPDAQGVFVDAGISLGHNRLSVIDLSSDANQPMHNNDKTLTIVFNGEIYNFRELRKELEGMYAFRTKSDTEVILAGYKMWGEGVVDRLNGMFAFAIWDRQKQKLFCARDRAGIKPFYYFWDGKRFIFASEIKGILKHDVPRTLNIEAFNHYMRVLYVPEPMTMMRDIYKLPPKHTLTLKDGDLSVAEYCDEPSEVQPRSYKEAVSMLREKVISAVGRQLVSDVPVGVYLSGGIDSSAVLFSMTQFNKNAETFSVGFDLGTGEESEKFNSDLRLAKQTAEFFGVKHNQILISAKDARNHLEEVIGACDDPISNPTSVAMMLLARFAKDKVSVVLTGSGGDELFGGYDRYRAALAAYYYKKLPGALRSLGDIHPKVAKLDYQSGSDFLARVMFEKDPRLSKVLSPSVFKDDSFSKQYFEERYISQCSGDLADCLMETDQKSWLPDHFFMLSDKMSMSSALEERVPLTDNELIAFSQSLPRSYKLDLFRTKKILKDAFRDDLPGFLFDQPKRGWFSPGAKWLRNKEFAGFAKEVLSKDYYKGTKDLFNWMEVEDMLEKHVSKDAYNLTILWAILTFQVWARTYEIEI
ncbi:MAG: asparagine synthase (glutamine-hydrolyzing) [Candidatus Pacebacteria bacterium]|nr:asparagine synthase (glutamine-hydrolyzing) [Candidatus Paceibacterota bacterium]